jgi:undecaprenyl-phosphate 4-deoxy-4-formamido-L-arabinose transferase
MGAETATKVSAFRAFRRDLREAFSDFRGPYVSLDVLLTWATTKFASVVVDHQPRKAGRSNYTLSKLVVHSFNMMTGFSTLPLQLASMVGFVSTFFGIVLLLFVVGRYLLEGGVVPGFAFLACTIAIFSGAQLFAIGIFGEYLARMHFRVMDRPAYAVRAVTGKN